MQHPTAPIEFTSALTGLSESLQLVAQLQADYRAAQVRHQQQLVELAGRLAGCKLNSKSAMK